MKRFILALVCMVVLLASPVWGDPVELPTWECKELLWAEEIQKDKPSWQWACAEWYTFDAGTLSLPDADYAIFAPDPSADIVLELDDVLHALKRCREFVDDYEYSSQGELIDFLVHEIPPTEYEYLKKRDENKIQHIENKLRTRDRERQLRKDIETLIPKLEAICENYQ